MDNPQRKRGVLTIVLKNANGIIAGAGNRLWLPVSESHGVFRPDLVQCGDVFFDVVGYSEKRKSYLICPIVIDGAADKLEEEMDGK